MLSSINDYLKWLKYSKYGLPKYEIDKIILSMKQNDYEYFQSIIKNFKKYKININLSINHFDETMLHKAAIFNRIEFCKLLLGAGADINVMNKYGQTPLLKAVRFMDFDLCQYFIDLGADVNCSDMHGISPLMEAGASRCKETNKIFFFLVNSGANIYHHDKYDVSVTNRAVESRNYAVTKYLMPFTIVIYQ